MVTALAGLTLGAGLLGACHLLAYGDLREQKAAAGQACIASSECRTGYCADGVCCEEPCTASCMACDLGSSGLCRPRPVGPDPAGGCDGTCNGSGTCVEGALTGIATMGDGTTQAVNALAVDELDNVIVGGTYDGTLQLGSVKPPPTVEATAFVARFSTNGVPDSSYYTTDVLSPLSPVDTFSVGATGAGDVVIAGSASDGVALDAWVHVPERWSTPVMLGGRGTEVGLRALGHPNGVVVLGRYGRGSALIGPTTLPPSSKGAFVALLDDDGAVAAVLGLGSSVAVGPGGITVTAAGDIYVAGVYEGALESQSGLLLKAPLALGAPPAGVFGRGGSTGDTWVSGTGSGIFVLRLAPDLSVTWAQKLGGSPDEDEPLVVVAPIGSERVAVVWNDVATDSQLVALQSTDGAPLWSESLPATVHNLAGDAAGPVLAGHIIAPIAFASGELSVLGPADTAIVAAYDENGGQRWGRSLAPGRARAVAVDTQGHVVVGGSYSGVFDLGVGTPSSTADQDGFVAELNAEGQPLWQQSLASREPQRVRAMIPFQGDLLVGGAFSNAMSSGAAFLTGGDDGFVARWSQDLAPGWLLHVSGDGPQTVTGLAEGLIPNSDRRIFVAVCANEQVVAGSEVVSNGKGITIFSVTDSGTYTGSQHVIEANADVVCDSNVQMTRFDNELIVAGHVPALAFERQAFLKRLRFDDLGELEAVDLGAAQITGLAVTLKEIFVGGFNQPQGAGNEGFIASHGRVSLEANTELRFPAETVLLHAIDETSIAAVIASNTAVSIQGTQIIPDGSTTNGMLGIFTTGLDDDGDAAINLQSLVGLGPMSPTSLEVDDDGNIVIGGELTEPVVWNGQFLSPAGVDSFVLKVSRDGTRLGFEHLSGSGDATLAAIASGSAGEVFAGGSFDGSLLVGEVGEIYGSGVDGMLVCVGR